MLCRSWGILSLTIAYFWQLYTLWILVQLHEAVPGKRYNRYVELAQAAFGELEIYVHPLFWKIHDPTCMFNSYNIVLIGTSMKIHGQKYIFNCLNLLRMYHLCNQRLNSCVCMWVQKQLCSGKCCKMKCVLM